MLKMDVVEMKDYPILINCIVAIDEDNGIAAEINGVNSIPWKIADDMTFFRKVTLFKKSDGKINAVIMGRKTWDEIPEKYRPLKNRLNIVITSKPLENNTNLMFFNSIESALHGIKERTNEIENIYICGGISLYNYFMNSDLITNLYLTTIHKKYGTTLKISFDRNSFETIWKYNHMTIDEINGKAVNITFEKLLNKKRIDRLMNDDCSVLSFMTDTVISGSTDMAIGKSTDVISNNEETHYLELLNNIITTGHYRQTRNSKTWCLFSNHMTFDLKDGSFPLLTTKKMFLRGIFEELKFFMCGQTDTKILEEKGVNIWKGNTSKEFIESVKLPYEEGDMGPMYGFQLRHYGAEYSGCKSDYTDKGVDQFTAVIETLKKDKYSRRIIMTTYNPAQVHLGVLPPCHGITIQFGIEGENNLCCHMYQRSADFFLGIPFNIASYALLVNIMCEMINNDSTYTGTKFVPGKLTMSIGDYHVYECHLDVVKEQVSRKPYAFPKLKINKKITRIEELNFEDIELQGYTCHPALKASMVA